jgi:hypothetical protein
MKIYIIKKGHFYKRLSKDSYNKSKLLVKKWDDNNLLNTLKKHSQWGSKPITRSQKDYFGKGLQVLFPKKHFYMQMNFWINLFVIYSKNI